MLATSSPIAFVATTRPEQCRAFYEGTLGLTLLADDQFSLVFDLAGVPLRVQKVRELQAQPFTALGWQVADIAGMVGGVAGARSGVRAVSVPAAGCGWGVGCAGWGEGGVVQGSGWESVVGDGGEGGVAEGFACVA